MKKFEFTKQHGKYKQGEVITVTIENNLEGSILAILGPYSIGIIEQKGQDGIWKNLTLHPPPPPYAPTLESESVKVGPGGTHNFSWDQKIFDNETGQSPFVGSGTFRIKVNYVTESEARKLGYPDKEVDYIGDIVLTPIFSEEFIIL